jgi:hypothetical protein
MGNQSISICCAEGKTKNKRDVLRKGEIEQNDETLVDSLPLNGGAF